MPPSAQAVRLSGDALMGLGAHRRSFALLLAGAAVIAAGWSNAAGIAAPGRAGVGRRRAGIGVPPPGSGAFTCSLGSGLHGHELTPITA
jgi:hypothetical protein